MIHAKPVYRQPENVIIGHSTANLRNRCGVCFKAGNLSLNDEANLITATAADTDAVRVWNIRYKTVIARSVCTSFAKQLLQLGLK